MNKHKYIMAITMALMMVTGTALADSVDIGLGTMDRAEFDSLRQMMSGDYQSTAFVTSEQPQEVYVAEFDQSVVDDIRQGMTKSNSQEGVVASASEDTLVDVGLGSMPTNEFCDLNKLVASNTTQKDGLTFICP